MMCSFKWQKQNNLQLDLEEAFEEGTLKSVSVQASLALSYQYNHPSENHWPVYANSHKSLP